MAPFWDIIFLILHKNPIIIVLIIQSRLCLLTSRWHQNLRKVGIWVVVEVVKRMQIILVLILLGLLPL